jgi:hypothetical protein
MLFGGLEKRGKRDTRFVRASTKKKSKNAKRQKKKNRSKTGKESRTEPVFELK